MTDEKYKQLVREYLDRLNKSIQVCEANLNRAEEKVRATGAGDMVEAVEQLQRISIFSAKSHSYETARMSFLSVFSDFIDDEELEQGANEHDS